MGWLKKLGKTLEPKNILGGIGKGVGALIGPIIKAPVNAIIGGNGVKGLLSGESGGNIAGIAAALAKKQFGGSGVGDFGLPLPGGSKAPPTPRTHIPKSRTVVSKTSSPINGISKFFKDGWNRLNKFEVFGIGGGMLFLAGLFIWLKKTKKL